MRKLLVALLATSFAVTAAQAQMVIQRGGPGGGTSRMSFGGTPPALEESPSDYGVRSWRVGQWARYSISINMGQMPLNQFHQVSIVGQQGERFWVETTDEFSGNLAMRAPVTKMLIPFGVIRERVGTDVIVMSPDSAISRRTLVRAASGGGPEGIDFPGSWTRVGEEDVTVAGGTFHAVHYRKGGDNLWVSGEVGPLGVVKFESDQVVIELTGKGENARSRIPYGG